MQEKYFGRAARFEDAHRETQGRFIVEDGAERDSAPRPGELVFEIGLALAGFLSLAVIAHLFVVAIYAG